MEKTYKPCANAPLERQCDIGTCTDTAVVDCYIPGASWGYLCLVHWVQHGSKEQTLVNNITASDITLAL